MLYPEQRVPPSTNKMLLSTACSSGLQRRYRLDQRQQGRQRWQLERRWHPQWLPQLRLPLHRQHLLHSGQQRHSLRVFRVRTKRNVQAGKANHDRIV